MKVPEKLRTLGIDSWPSLFLWAGIAIAAIGLLGELLGEYFELMVPLGVLLALAPTFVLVILSLLWVLMYLVTGPVRLWCLARMWFLDRSSDPDSVEYNRLLVVLWKLDNAGNRLFEW